MHEPHSSGVRRITHFDRVEVVMVQAVTLNVICFSYLYQNIMCTVYTDRQKGLCASDTYSFATLSSSIPCYILRVSGIFYVPEDTSVTSGVFHGIP